jgi:hypothetical protein
VNRSKIRSTWNSLRDRITAEALDAKSAPEAVLELSARYRALPQVDRIAVDEVISEWVTADDESKRYDALALISEHEIVAAIPALQVLVQRLALSADPGARFERAKVARLLAKLVSVSS